MTPTVATQHDIDHATTNLDELIGLYRNIQEHRAGRTSDLQAVICVLADTPHDLNPDDRVESLAILCAVALDRIANRPRLVRP